MGKATKRPVGISSESMQAFSQFFAINSDCRFDHIHIRAKTILNNFFILPSLWIQMYFFNRWTDNIDSSAALI